MALIADSLIGHQEQLQKLKDLLQKDLLSHAYLFVGSQGIGKKLFARAFCQISMCQNRGCGKCGDCLKIESNQHESLLYIEPDGAQIKISQAQDIHQFLNLKSTTPRRFVIIENAHQMNVQAANSLLKVMEEPPQNTHFILISPTEQSVLKTLRSRSQLIRFAPLSKEQIQSKMNLPDWILNASHGRFDMIQILMTPEMDNLRKKAFQIIQNSQSLSLKQTFSDLKETVRDRETALYVILCWMQFLRDLSFYKSNIPTIIHADHLDLLESLKSLPDEKIFSLFEIAKQVEKDIQGNVDRVLAFENWTLEYTT